MEIISLTIFIPVVAALIFLISSRISVHYFVITLTLVALSIISLYIFSTPLSNNTFSFSPLLEILFVVLDILLLLFFAHQGFYFKSPKVLSLALLQLVLFILAEASLDSQSGTALIVDGLSLFMFLIINIVGGTIIFYALKYMQSEESSSMRKRLFIVYLLLFIAIMNLIVMANSLLLFFFLFEMTTLASYLLIGFRKDKISQDNALKALWMNQVGGVVILLASIIAATQYNTIYFDQLLTHSGAYLLLSMALLSMAAFVKGAALPFDSWLLGAMVAPTPVSAMLHSATMVKIAPYLILKLAPIMAGTLLGMSVSVLSALVFVVASYLALSRSMFKEILGYSTIALLGLMMSLAAIGTEQSIFLAMVIILFHALSKALLFLSAGILEKKFHLKYIEEMKVLMAKTPRTVGYIMFGFISLTLPPFGLFMGKIFAIESIVSQLSTQPWLIVVLLSIIIGSALLVLLYFKVASALLAKPSDTILSEKEPIQWGFDLPILFLIFMTLGVTLSYLLQQHDNAIMLLALPFLLIIIIPWFRRYMQGFDRVKPYHCGEDETFDAALFYFGVSTKTRELLTWSFAALFISLALVGVIS